MKQYLALGLDLSEERRDDKRLAQIRARVEANNTFKFVAREWLTTRQLSWTPRHAALVVGRLEADILPVIGKLDIGTMIPRQILEAIRKIETRGAIEMAHRVKNHCSEIFRYAIPDSRCVSDPCRDLSPCAMPCILRLRSMTMMAPLAGS